MIKSNKALITEELNRRFREEIRLNVKHKLDEINHYVSGVDSPFNYMTISDVQEHLCVIAEILGINESEETE